MNYIIKVRGYAGPGWEIECRGAKRWVEKTIKKYIPRVKGIALARGGKQ